MISNNENSDRSNEKNNTEPLQFGVILILIKIVIVAVFLLPLAGYLLKPKINGNVTEINQIKIVTIDDSLIETVETTTEIVIERDVDSKVNISKNKQTDYRFALFKTILKEFVNKYELCNQNDFDYMNQHTVLPKDVGKEHSKKVNAGKKEAPVPAIVNYAVGIILVVSLTTALIELYKAKYQPVKKDGKHSLSRKCSLADLTVMKHQRKEMIRRDSILEVPEGNISSKQLGHKLVPFQRQHSFPLGPSSPLFMGTNNRSAPINGRRLSIQNTTRYVPVVDGKPATVLQGRRHSIISDGRQPLIAVESNRTRGVLISDRTVDDILERRYYGHGRRVHRH